MQEIASVGMTRGGEALTVDVAGLAAEHGHGKKSELHEHMRQSGFVLVVQGKRRPLEGRMPPRPIEECRRGNYSADWPRPAQPFRIFAPTPPSARTRAAIAARNMMA